MTITTKFDEGETVNYMHEGKVQSGKIHTVYIKVEDDTIYISYRVSLGVKRGNVVTVIEKPEGALFLNKIAKEQK